LGLLKILKPFPEYTVKSLRETYMRFHPRASLARQFKLQFPQISPESTGPSRFRAKPVAKLELPTAV
jgi:hypothetical protein